MGWHRNGVDLSDLRDFAHSHHPQPTPLLQATCESALPNGQPCRSYGAEARTRSCSSSRREHSRVDLGHCERSHPISHETWFLQQGALGGTPTSTSDAPCAVTTDHFSRSAQRWATSASSQRRQSRHRLAFTSLGKTTTTTGSSGQLVLQDLHSCASRCLRLQR